MPPILKGRTGTHRIIAALYGITIGTAIFLGLVFVLAATSSEVDTSVVQNKVAAAINTSQIPYFGKRLNDYHGEMFCECLVLEASIINHGRLWNYMFDTLVYDWKGHPTCDNLVESIVDRAVATPISYYRYWWGSAVIARIALGVTRVSIASYQQLVMMLTWVALILLVLAFFVSYGRASLAFLPLFLALAVGYNLPKMGSSIAFAPEFIAGVLLLAGYCVVKVHKFSIRTRAVFYSVLGGACVYFDLMDGTVVLIAIVLCCQMSAPYATRLLNPNYAQITPSYARLVQETIVNLSFVVVGGCVAILIRILGYSIVHHSNVLEVTTGWMSNLSQRVSGSLLLESHDNASPTLRRVLDALRSTKNEPFRGFLNNIGADIFYGLGFAAWPIAMLLCWKLHRKGVSPVAAVGIVMAATLVPTWYLFFKQHTIIHPHLTGRLVTLFCGLGMSLAVLAGWALARTYSSRGWEKRKHPVGAAD